MGARIDLPPPGDISLLEIYRRMVLVRALERARHELWLQRRLSGELHLALGQEAVSVGLVSALRPDDWLWVSRRGLTLHVARGLPPEEALTGNAPGDDPPSSVGQATPAGHLAAAVGAALGMRLRNEPRICLVEFGDGAAGDGLFHESLNLAALWRVPIVFACVNNQYAGDRPYEMAHSVESVAARAVAYGIASERVDGQDAQAVLAATQGAVDRARNGAGPALVECLTYRTSPHVLRHPTGAEERRSREEVDFWRNRDPLRRFRAVLVRRHQAHVETLDVIAAAACAEVEQAVGRRFGPARLHSAPGRALLPVAAATVLER